MPFQSKAQMRLCFSKMLKARASGKKSTWDCDKWLKETKNVNSLPNKKYSGKKSSQKGHKTLKVSSVKTGARGGKYIIVGGNKMYLKDKKVIKYASRRYGVDKKSLKKSSKRK
jgi:hypothetical protein